MLGSGFWAQDKCRQVLILCHHLLFPEVQVRGVGQPSWKSMPPLAALQHDLCSLPSTDRYVTLNMTYTPRFLSSCQQIVCLICSFDVLGDQFQAV